MEAMEQRSDQTDTSDQGQPYVLGHSPAELARLAVQARLVDPITRRFFSDAGIAPGMRVLDVGSGVGDVAFLVCGIVGPLGEVVGTDRSSTALAVARQRADVQGLGNVKFVEGDPAGMHFDTAFDAIVGRYVLMFQPDPAAMLRKLVSHLRPGGIVAFHEPDRKGARSFPVVPDYDRGGELIDETLRLTGADSRMGIKLHSTFLAAGLPAPAMRLEAVIGGGSNSSDQVRFEMDVVRTLSEDMERLGLITDSGFDLESISERVEQYLSLIHI